jgi:hypothetical protein
VWLSSVSVLFRVSERAPSGKRIAPGVEAGSSFQVKLEVMTQAADDIALQNDATNR